MLLISRTSDGTLHPKRFSAPKGFQFLIEAIHHTVMSSGNNDILIFDRRFDDDVKGAIVVAVQSRSDTMASFNTDANGNQSMTGLNHKTKYITIARRTSTAILAITYIYGEIVPLSREEAIWEFIAKRTF